MCLLPLDEFQRGGGTCVMVTRGVDGLAKLGGMGPHVAALVRHSENEIKVGLRGHSQPFVEHGRRFSSCFSFYPSNVHWLRNGEDNYLRDYDISGVVEIIVFVGHDSVWII